MVLKPAKSMSRYGWLGATDVVFSKKADVAENYNSLNEFAFCAKHLFIWNVFYACFCFGLCFCVWFVEFQMKLCDDNICPFRLKKVRLG